MKKFLPAIIVAIVLIGDQWLKIHVKLNFKLYESYAVFGDWFELYFIENPGMAFGWAFGGDIGKLILSLFRIIASVLIFRYWRNIIKTGAPLGYQISIGLIFAGAVGNIFDSLVFGQIFSESLGDKVASFMPVEGGYAPVFFGNVVDMLHFPLWEWPMWMPIIGGDTFFSPIFNIADASITGGIIVIFLFFRKYFEKEFEKKKKDKASNSDVEAV